MRELKKKVEFITQAFLVGGDQGTAELRAASIRGELRWWFRVLGGTKEMEASVFGGIQPQATASKVVVRVGNVVAKHEPFPKFSAITPMGYLSYFASASKGNGDRAGVRVDQDAYFAPGTTFELSVAERRHLSEDEFGLLEKAFECLIRLGTLGYRSTRTFGAMAEMPEISRDEFAKWVATLPRKIVVRAVNDLVCGKAKDAQIKLGEFLKPLRKENHLGGKSETAFGFSAGQKRAASALRLRPVKVKEGFLPVVVYTDMACACPSQESLVVSETVSI